MRRGCALIAAAIALHAVDARGQTPTQPDALARLSWMAGCWMRQSATAVVEEQWMSPRGGMMLGMSRTTRGDRVVEYEQSRLLVRGSDVVFAVLPSGQPAAEFTATVVSDTMLVVRNAAHDFPQAIVYRRRGADSLLARIEGTINGQARSVDFPYVRARCPGG